MRHRVLLGSALLSLAVSGAPDAFAQAAPDVSAAPPEASFPESASSAAEEAPPDAAADAPPSDAPVEPPPPPSSAPPPVFEPPPPPSRARRGEESADAMENDEDERGLYVLAALLGAGHVHASQYEIGDAGEFRMSSAGLAYELLLMIGSHKKGFAFGGGASFVHAPRPKLRLEVPHSPKYQAEARPGIFALTVGPSVDYRPTRVFHIGGLIGLAVESVPKFAFEPAENETLAGFGAGLWLGFDWKAGTDLRPGILFTGHVRQEALRDVDGSVGSDENAEVSVSLGLGFSLAYR